MNLKYVALSCLLTAVSGGMNAQSEEGYRVKIQLKKPADGMFMVSERVPNSTMWFTDTLQLKKGKTVHTGKVQDPCLVTYALRSENEDFLGSFSIFLDNSPRIEVKGDNLCSLRVTGSPAHAEYERIEKEGRELFANYGTLRYKYGKAFGNKALRDSLEPHYKQAYERIYDYILGLPGYAESKVAAYYVYDYFINDASKLEEALSKFSSSLDSNIYIKSCKEELARKKKIAVGRQAFDFCLSDLEGKQYRLSDYKGKYVLIEFSASWCGWCKKEIPFLKKVYEAHKDNDNFRMFTINLDDKREKWEKDVKELGLPWPVISDLKAFKSEVTAAYNVHGIPMIFLISPDGRIVANNLRGEKMIQTVDRLLTEMNTFPFTIKGEVDQFNGGCAYLYTLPPENKLLDSCLVQNNRFTLNGRLEKNQRGLLFVQGADKLSAAINEVYVQRGTIGVSLVREGRKHRATYTDAPLQAEWEALMKAFKETEEYKKYARINDEVQQEFLKKNSASPKLKAKQQAALFEAIQVIAAKENYRKKEVLTSLIYDYCGLLTTQQLELLCASLDASLHESYYLTKVRKYIAQENLLANGQLAKDFTAQDLSGKSVSLSDFKGKYVFLEFSASWCSWCKKEIPYIRKAIEALKDKNIVFITLMMDDKRERWEQDVKKQNITWLNLSDLKGMRHSQIAKDYNVSGIPASFVINPDGVIIDRDLRGDRILQQLKEYVK